MNIYKHKIGGKVSPEVPHTENPNEVVNLGQVREEVAGGEGGSGSVISSIIPVTQNYLLTTASNNAILRVKDYASVIVPSGLGLKHRTVIKKATGKTVSLTEGEHVILETPSGYVAQILAEHDYIEITCEEIDENGIEYWGVAGALIEGEAPTFLDVSETSVTTSAVMFPQIHLASDWNDLFTFTKEYFIVYSSDHDVAQSAVIFWGECDDPEGGGFIERGQIVTGHEGYQPEGPMLVRIPTSESGQSNEACLYFHTLNSPDNATGAQETHLISTSGGSELHNSTWLDEGKPLPRPNNEVHTGYLVVYKRGVGDYIGRGLAYRSANSGETSIYHSVDGRNWTVVINPIDRTANIPNGGFVNTRFCVHPFELNGTRYGIIQYYDPSPIFGIFEIDTNNLPTLFVKNILEGFHAHDPLFYVKDDVAYIFIYKNRDGSTGVNLDTVLRQFKYYLPEAV